MNTVGIYRAFYSTPGSIKRKTSFIIVNFLFLFTVLSVIGLSDPFSFNLFAKSSLIKVISYIMKQIFKFLPSLASTFTGTIWRWMLSTQYVAISFKLWFIHFCRVYLSCLYLACLLHLSLVSFLCEVLVQGSMMFKQLEKTYDWIYTLGWLSACWHLGLLTVLFLLMFCCNLFQ